MPTSLVEFGPKPTAVIALICNRKREYKGQHWTSLSCARNISPPQRITINLAISPAMSHYGNVSWDCPTSFDIKKAACLKSLLWNQQSLMQAFSRECYIWCSSWGKLCYVMEQYLCHVTLLARVSDEYKGIQDKLQHAPFTCYTSSNEIVKEGLLSMAPSLQGNSA